MSEFLQMSDLRPFSQTVEGDALITESFTLKKEIDVLSHMYLFTVMASYQGEKAPTVEFSLFNNGTRLYISHTYNFAARNNMTIKQWRVPPALFYGTKMVVSVTVPEGTTLTVRSFGADICSGVKDWNGGITFFFSFSFSCFPLFLSHSSSCIFSSSSSVFSPASRYRVKGRMPTGES